MKDIDAIIFDCNDDFMPLVYRTNECFIVIEIKNKSKSYVNLNYGISIKEKKGLQRVIFHFKQLSFQN